MAKKVKEVFYKLVRTKPYDKNRYSFLVSHPDWEMCYVPHKWIKAKRSPGICAFATLEQAKDFMAKSYYAELWEAEGVKEKEQSTFIRELDLFNKFISPDKNEEYIVTPPNGTVFLSEIKLMKKIL